MGYMVLWAECLVCKGMFGSNPALVPSYNDEPIFQMCLDIVNEKRVENNLQPFIAREGAYEPQEVN